MRIIDNKIGVVGAGTMGNGIAHVFAMAGFEVILVDIAAESLEKAEKTITKNLDRMLAKERIDADTKAQTISNLSFDTQLSSLSQVDLVVEAVSESTTIKFDVFKKLDTICKPSCILASNTSSISITKIAAQTKRPSQVIGMHFMNPVPVMKLVEVVNGYDTSSDTTNHIIELAKVLKKTPISVKDYPGFISNRILMPMINEAIYALHEGVADVLAIDGVMKLGMAHPMGPLLLADFIGLDVCLSILEVLNDGFKLPKYAPCPLLVKMVEAGKLGVKSGEGFYVHDRNSKEKRVAPYFDKL